MALESSPSAPAGPAGPDDDGAIIDTIDGGGDTALHLACHGGHLESVTMLLKAGLSTEKRAPRFLEALNF